MSFLDKCHKTYKGQIQSKDMEKDSPLIPAIVIVFFVVASIVIAHFYTGGEPYDAGYSEYVNEEYWKLGQGSVILNVPDEMKVGTEETVEICVTKVTGQDLMVGLEEEGNLQVVKVKVGTFMGACVRGEAFDILALSSEEQIIPEYDFTQWKWIVMPKRSGIQSLFFTITVRIKMPNGDEEKKDLFVLKKQVLVQRNPTRTITAFLENNWQWIITTIGALAVGWIAKEIRRKRRSEEKG